MPINLADISAITDNPCLIESVVIHALATQTADLTSCGVFGGASKVIIFISAAVAVASISKISGVAV